MSLITNSFIVTLILTIIIELKMFVNYQRNMELILLRAYDNCFSSCRYCLSNFCAYNYDILISVLSRKSEGQARRERNRERRERSIMEFSALVIVHPKEISKKARDKLARHCHPNKLQAKD
jgi:hypothetical protein